MRVGVVANSAPGHVFPAAALAKAFGAAGHEACLVTGAEWLPALERDGIAAQALPTAGKRPHRADIGPRLWGWAADVAPALADTFRESRLDAVVVDTLTVAGSFAAGLAGLPWVELIPHPLQDLSPHLPPPGSGLAPGQDPLRRARDRLLRPASERGIARGRAERAEVRRALGIPPDARPAGRLVATLPALELPRPDWPQRTEVVGPMEWDPADVDLALPAGDAPVVFVSASTAPGGADGLFEAALAACGELGLRLACTQFAAYDGALPPWAVVGPGRQAPVLEAASVVVAGAGHGIVAKALVRGLPLVMLPGGGEQFDNAQRVRRAGAGVRLMPFRLTPQRLAHRVARVLRRPSYAAAARRLGDSGAGLGPAYAAETAVRLLTSA